MRTLSSLGAAVSAAAFLFTSIIGCGDDAGGGISANVDELFEYGSYEVGYREFPITYTAAATGENREVLLRVWYPAEPDSGAPSARYAVGGIVDLPAGIALDAPPANEDSDRPFVVYSHGNGGEGLLAYPYGELMASHGWILVAPNHTGNTAFDFLETPDPFTRSALDRPYDITAVIDEFESGLSGDDLAGKADTAAVFLFGHSFGGYTTFATGGVEADVDGLLASCEGESNAGCDLLANEDVEAAYRAGFLDERIVAVAPQAPAISSLLTDPETDLFVGLADIPTMVMSGTLDATTPYETSAVPSWEGTNDPNDIWVNMPKGAHYTFLSICYDLEPDILAFFRPDAGVDGCDPEFVDAEEAMPVLQAYVMAFGRRHVLGEVRWDSVLKGPPLGNEGDFVITTREP